MKTMIVALLLIAGATASRPQDPESREKAILPESYLPDGEARDVILQGCVQCHDLRNTVSQRKTLSAWRRTVNEMIWRGAPLMADEADTITRYLSVSFGPDKPVPDALKKKTMGGKR